MFYDSKVLKVIPHRDFTLSLWFAKNPKQQCLFDFKPLLKNDRVFAPLKDINFFMKAHADFSTVVWNDQMDIASECLYMDSDPIDEYKGDS